MMAQIHPAISGRNKRSQAGVLTGLGLFGNDISDLIDRARVEDIHETLGTFFTFLTEYIATFLAMTDQVDD